MVAVEEERLQHIGALFRESEAPSVLSAGYGRQWPDARGVFLGKEQVFFAWVNNQDHLTLVSRSFDGDIGIAFDRLIRADAFVEAQLRKDSGRVYAHGGGLGFLTACPSNSGTAMVATMVL